MPIKMSITNKESIKRLAEIMTTDLTEREKSVLKYRLGLYGMPQCSLKRIGEILNISKARVNQIQAKAIRKLLHPERRSHPIIREMISTPPLEKKNKRLNETIEYLKSKYNGRIIKLPR